MEQVVAEELNEDTQKNKYLTFSLDNDLYGIEIQYVIEIVGMAPITVVPELPDYAKGIINLRGKIIPVIDIRMRFNKGAIMYNERTCIIIVEMKNLSVGIIVDAVSEVMSIYDEDTEKPPNWSKNGKDYIRTIGKSGDKIIMIIDCNQLLEENDEENFNNLKS